MIRKVKYILFIGFLTLSSIGFSQTNFSSEEELIKGADNLFKQKEYPKTMELYSQLLSNHPEEATYLYRYAVSTLFASSDKKKALEYLERTAQKPGLPNQIWFYLAKAYHFNYDFDKAIVNYTKFNGLASSAEKAELNVLREIEMCKNGIEIVNGKVVNISVFDIQSMPKSNFYAAYDATLMGGKVLAKLDEFKSAEDKKENDASPIFLPDNSEIIFYSSKGKTSKGGRDLYMAKRLPTGQWAEGVNLGDVINTTYDEDYPYFHPYKNILYFSSKGHTSIGGYDIFMSIYNDENQTWTKPVNIGFSLNSTYDDIYYVPSLEDEYAFFASERNAEYNRVNVFQVKAVGGPAEFMVVKGTMVDKSDPENKTAQIIVYDVKTSQLIGKYNTNKINGNYILTLTPNSEYKLIASSYGYKDYEEVIYIPEVEDQKPIEQQIVFGKQAGIDAIKFVNFFDSKKPKPVVDTNTEKEPEAAAVKNLNALASLQVNTQKPAVFVEKPKAKPVVKEYTEEELIAMVESQKELNKNMEAAINLKVMAANSTANSKKAEFGDKKQEKQKLESQLASATNDTEKGFIESKINNVNQEIDQLEIESGVASRIQNILSNEQQKIKTQKEQLDLALNTYIKAKADNDFDDEKQMLQKQVENNKVVTGNFKQDKIVEDAISKYKEDYNSSNSQKQQLYENASAHAQESQKLIEDANLLEKQRDEAKGKEIKAELELQAKELRVLAKEEEAASKSSKFKAQEIEKGMANSEKQLAAATSIGKQIDKISASAVINDNLAINAQNSKGDLNDVNLESIESRNSSQPSKNIDVAKVTVPVKITESNKTETTINNKAAVNNSSTNNSSKKESLSFEDDNPNNFEQKTTDDYSEAAIVKEEIKILEQDVAQIRADASITVEPEIKEQLLFKADLLEKEIARKKSGAPAPKDEEIDDTFVFEEEPEPIEAKLATNKVIEPSKPSNLDKEIAALKLADAKNTAQVKSNNGNIPSIPNSELKVAATEELSFDDVFSDEPALIEETKFETGSQKIKKAEENDDFVFEDNLNTDNNTNTNVAVNSSNTKTDDFAFEDNLNTKTNTNTNVAVNNTQKDEFAFEDNKAVVNPTTEAKSANNIATNSVETTPKSDNASPVKTENVIVANSENVSTNNSLSNQINVEAYKNPEAKENAVLANELAQQSIILNKEAKTLEADLSSITDPNIKAAMQDKLAVMKNDAVKLESNSNLILAAANKIEGENANSNLAANTTTNTKNDLEFTFEDEPVVTVDNTKTSTPSKPVNNDRTATQPAITTTTETQIKDDFTFDDEPALATNNTKTNTSNQPVNNNKVAQQPVNNTPKAAATTSTNDTTTNKTNISSPAKIESPSDIDFTAVKTVKDIEKYSQNYKSPEAKGEFENSVALMYQADEYNQEAEQLKESLASITDPIIKEDIEFKIGSLQRISNDKKKEAEFSFTRANKIETQSGAGATSNNELAFENTFETPKTNSTNNELSFNETKNAVTPTPKNNNPPAVNTANLNSRLSNASTTIPTQPREQISFNEVALSTQEIEAVKATPEYIKFEAVKEEEAAQEDKVNELVYFVKDTKEQTESLMEDIESIEDPELKQQYLERIKTIEANGIEKASQVEGAKQDLEAKRASTNEYLNTLDAVTKNKILTVSGPTQTQYAVSGSSQASLTPSNKVQTNFTPKQLIVTTTEKAFYSNSNPIPIDAPLPSGVIFKVQVGAFSKPIPQDLFKGIQPLRGETTNFGVTRYTAGEFNEYGSADAAKQQVRNMGYKDAFVVAFYNGKRIGNNEAVAMLNGNGSSNSTAGTLASANTKTTNSNTNTNNSFQESPVYNTPVNSNTSETNQTTNNTASTSNNNLTSKPNNSSNLTTVELYTTGKQSNPVTGESLRGTNGLLYTVQVGVYSRQITSADLYDLSPLFFDRTKNDLYKYTTGIYNNKAEATNAKDRITALGIKDAFVVVYYNGSKIDFQNAEKLETYNRSAVLTKANPISSETFESSETNNLPITGDIVFKVQIGAYQFEVPTEVANNFFAVIDKGLEFNKNEQGVTVYTLGSFKSNDQAQKLKQEISNLFADAFVVAYANGIKVPLSKAIQASQK